GTILPIGSAGQMIAMALDSSALIDALGRGKILTAAQLDKVARDVQPRFPNARALINELRQRGWLTAYQAELLLQERGVELVLGPYVLLDKLGEGGMGAVYRARHTMLNRVVALKVMRKERMANPEAVRRFRREIQSAAQLSHPNIVHAFDADEVAGAHYYVMEYVEGRDLGRLVKECGPLPVAEAIDYIRQTALGLQHAFERGLVH